MDLLSSRIWTRTLVGLLTASQTIVWAADSSIEQRLRALEQQNEALRQQLEAQQQTIQDLKSRLEDSSGDADPAQQGRGFPGGLNFGKVHIGGEGGVGFFHTGSTGQYRNSPFRVDEAKLFLEAPLWEGTYFFSELDLVTRETIDEFFRLGELYVDFENILRYWTDQPYLSLRIGRLDIPFGEEYLERDVIDNPLISHSLSDIWGVDEGVELYGRAGKFDYVLAVQNGGHPTLKDWNRDKSVAGRVGFNPNKHFRFSLSGMRTGDLSARNDRMSEVWIGNGFFRSIASTGENSTYGADLYELDGHVFWTGGHLKLAGGYFRYDDNDPIADNRRDGFYYYAEGLQQFTRKLYGASRFSHIMIEDGLPMVGFGDFGDHFFNGPLTTDLWRWSFGLGYRWSEHLVTKLEYAIERGEFAGGADRAHENFFGAQVGFQF